MAYVLLFSAIAAEVFATTMLKFAAGFTRLVPSVLCVAGYIVCYFCFGKAVQKINLAIAYALWCGMRLGVWRGDFWCGFRVGYANISQIP